MHRPTSLSALLLLTAAILITTAGCDNDDDRMWRLSRDVTQASRELVAADSEARREMIVVHRELQEERQSLDRQHEHLEDERREIAARRHRDPLVANALLMTGLVMAALLPLAVAWRLLEHQFSQSEDAQLVDVLVAEMTSPAPALMPPPVEQERLTEADADDHRTGRPDDGHAAGPARPGG